MKRTIILSAALLAVLTLAAGCSSTASNGSSAVGSNTTGTAGNYTAGGMRRPDFGQPQQPADLRGVVTSVVGNQVTMLKIALGGGGGRGRASSTPTATGNASTSNTPALSITGGAGRGGAGGGFYRGGAGGGSSATNRAAMIANLEKTSTGSETIIVPVGIKMMKSAIDPNTQKRTMVEGTLNDINTDSMITVWLNPAATSTKVAEFVLINN